MLNRKFFETEEKLEDLINDCGFSEKRCAFIWQIMLIVICNISSSSLQYFSFSSLQRNVRKVSMTAEMNMLARNQKLS